MFRMIQLALPSVATPDFPPAHRRNRSRRAFTLLELMIATAITLLMMISLVQVFKTVGDSMKQGRAVLQLNNTLRSATFRLRNDLNNLTLRVDPPANFRTGSGYLEYFDGSMTDSTCTLFDELTSVDARLTSSRFGDMDDILMFTARAGGDTWFVGQVPNFILNPALLSAPAQDTDSDGTPDAIEMVTINSQLAEIVVFARPVSTDPATLFDDVDGNHLPDAYQLYYRTLLIRPDLNSNFSGTWRLPNTSAVPSLGAWLMAGTPGSPSPPGPLDMVASHQQCDLSIRRVYDGVAGADAVAANSLEDLMNPANRFAHFEYPVSSVFSGSVSSTMPLLVLQPIPRSGSGAAGMCINVFGDDGNPSTLSPLYSDPNPGSMPSGLAGAAGNFLHPSFTLMATRRGEDVLVSDCLGFDVKIFDSGVPVIGLAGTDGTVGTTASAVLGADGSDDLILTPNDPGYAPALASSTAPAIVSYGAYVDLMWGRKTLASLPAFPPGSLTAGTVFSNQPGVNLWTEFSGLSKPASVGPGPAPVLPLVDGLLRSGKALVFPGGDPPVFLQPTFDTWSTYYETDGNLQAELTGPSVYGVVNVDQFKRMALKSSGSSDKAKARVTFRKTDIDAGTDGIDNDLSGGADDPAELETSPPFPVRPTGLKVSIRVGDRTSRQIKQMSVAAEFVTQ